MPRTYTVHRLDIVNGFVASRRAREQEWELEGEEEPHESMLNTNQVLGPLRKLATSNTVRLVK